MTKLETRQHGFAVLLIMVILAVAGGLLATGWFVYQHDRAKPQVGTNGGNVASQQVTQPATIHDSAQQQAIVQAQTLDIKEWGVHLTLDNTTASLYYYIKPGLPTVAYLSLKSISDLAPACAADKTSLGAIGKLTEAEQESITSGQVPGIAGTIHIGNYWYSYSSSHAACVDPAVQDAVNRAAPNFGQNTLMGIFKTLKAD